MKHIRTFALLPLMLGSLLLAFSGNDKVTAFEESGVIVDIQNFFEAAADQAESYTPVAGGQGRMALVTSSGVYAFLETPSNAALLAGIASGSSVKLTGRLLVNGTLLHIDKIKALDTDIDADLAKYRAAVGTTVELTGYNLCQCGLDVGELPHSCQLGHRHHLQADDGKIYHYLQYGEAQKAYLGQGSHFAQVAVKATVLPGQYLLVEQVTVK